MLEIYLVFSEYFEKALSNVTSRYCSTNYVWLAVTDDQEEGRFLDVSKSSSEAVFHQDGEFGEPIEVAFCQEISGTSKTKQCS